MVVTGDEHPGEVCDVVGTGALDVREDHSDIEGGLEAPKRERPSLDPPKPKPRRKTSEAQLETLRKAREARALRRQQSARPIEEPERAASPPPPPPSFSLTIF